MERYLAKKGCSEEEASQLVRDLQERGLLDDGRYARAMTRAQGARDKGPAYVRARLQGKGVRVDAGQARALYEEEMGASEAERIRAILERRYPQARTRAEERRRAFQAMLRRGFSAEAIRSALFGEGPFSSEFDAEGEL